MREYLVVELVRDGACTMREIVVMVVTDCYFYYEFVTIIFFINSLIQSGYG